MLQPSQGITQFVYREAAGSERFCDFFYCPSRRVPRRGDRGAAAKIATCRLGRPAPDPGSRDAPGPAGQSLPRRGAGQVAPGDSESLMARKAAANRSACRSTSAGGTLMRWDASMRCRHPGWTPSQSAVHAVPTSCQTDTTR